MLKYLATCETQVTHTHTSRHLVAATTLWLPLVAVFFGWSPVGCRNYLFAPPNFVPSQALPRLTGNDADFQIGVYIEQMIVYVETNALLMS